MKNTQIYRRNVSSKYNSGAAGTILGWTTPPKIKSIGKDDITEFEGGRFLSFTPKGQCCAKVKKAKRIDMEVDSYIPTGSGGNLITNRGIRDVIAHERRRQKVDKYGYKAYFKKAQGRGSYARKCGTICRKEPGKAKKLLQDYLNSLRSAMTDQFSAYWAKEQGMIGIENSNWRPYVERQERVGGVIVIHHLLDGYAWKHKVKRPSSV